MIVWAVANQKGGVGKTTTVVSLGGHLSQMGKKTLLIDLDPHGSLTSYFKHNPDTLEKSLYLLFQKPFGSPSPTELVLDTPFSNLFLLPASTALATLDRQLGAEEGKGLVIAKAVSSMDNDFDCVLIDCPPQLGVLMVNALAACQHLIIPVQTEFLALKGLERMSRTLRMITSALKKEIPFTILPTMFDQRTRASTNTLKALLKDYADNVWRDVIPVDTQFREASRAGIPLPIMTQRDRGALAYQHFLQYMLQRTGADDLPSAVA